MTDVHLRNLDGDLEARLRDRAASHGHSVEEEAEDILRAALGPVEGPAPDNLATRVRALFAPLGGVDLDIPQREPMRDAKLFDDGRSFSTPTSCQN